MTFDTEKEKASSKKINLVEIDLPVRRDNFINKEAGIWTVRINWDGATVIGSDGLTGYYPDELADITRVASLLVDDTAYTAVESMADLRTQNKSFYFIFGTQEVYIHFEDWHLPLDSVVRLGAVSGFCDRAQTDSDGRVIGSYYDGIYYRPCIRTVPSFKKKKDELFFGILAYGGGKIGFFNEDGYFDNFADGDVFGQPCRVKAGFNDLDYDDFWDVASGYIEDFSFDRENFDISIKDPRKFLTLKLPENVFSTDDYSDMNEDQEDVRKPLAWGSIKNAPCYCLNDEEAAPASYSFMFIDTEFHDAKELTTVRVNGEIKTPASFDLSAGTFTLATADYESGDDVTANFIGYEDSGTAIENGLDVLEDIMLNYGDISFIATNYNLGEFNFERSLAPDVGLWIGDDKKKSIQKAIEEICVACNGIFLNQDDGKWTFRTFRSDRPISRTILSDEWIDEPKKSYSSKKFLASCVVKYNQDIDESTYLNYRNTSYEDEVSNRYKQTPEKDFKTILTTLADAADLSETIMSISKEISPEVQRKTKWQHIDIEIMDFVVAEHSRVSGLDKKWAVWEIMSINKMLSSGENSLKMRYVRDYVPEERTYVQGDMWGEFIFGDRMYGNTRYEVA